MRAGQLQIPGAEQPFTIEEHPDRERWLKARQRSIGGSDAAVVWGVSPYASPYSLWADKVGAEPLQIDAEWLEIGAALEEPIAQLYAKRSGYRLLDPGRTTIYRSTRWPWMAVSLDRIILPDDNRGPGVLEVKNRGAYAIKSWESPPVEVVAQVQHELAVTGYQWGAIAALLGGNTFRYIEVERDEEFIALHVEKCREFYDMVRAGTPPEVDGSDATAEALRQLYEKETSGKRATLGALDEELAVKREALKAIIAENEKELQEVDNRLRAAIGDAEVAELLSGGGSFSLKTVNRKGHTVAPSSFRQLRWKPAKGGF